MFVSAHHIACVKRFARALIALAFLVGNTVPSYAQTLGAVSYAGSTAMMSVRIPFGGKGTTSSRPMVGLRFGSSWQAGPGSMSPQGYRFIPAVEAGFSFRGDPILKLASFDVLDQLRVAAEGTERQSFCGRNLSLCILAGVAVGVVAIVAIAGSQDSCAEAPPGYYPPGQDPCKCYEVDGCS
jgi:hypothetical protein